MKHWLAGHTYNNNQTKLDWQTPPESGPSTDTNFIRIGAFNKAKCVQQWMGMYFILITPIFMLLAFIQSYRAQIINLKVSINCFAFTHKYMLLELRRRCKAILLRQMSIEYCPSCTFQEPLIHRFLHLVPQQPVGIRPRSCMYPIRAIALQKP